LVGDLANAAHPVVQLEHQSSAGRQTLALTPAMGGSVASWQLERDGFKPFNLLRTWDGIDHPSDPLKIIFASYPLVPWSNRISKGGFSVAEDGGKFHPIALNAAGQACPIHGDGWQQNWDFIQPDATSLVMTLESNRFNGNPHHYRAAHTFKLVDGGMDQTLTITHLGDAPLPYGLGQHPWLPRNELTTVHAHVTGVWLSHPDCLPKEHTANFPPSWDMNTGMLATGSGIDNCFTGWDGQARVTWPDQQLELNLQHISVSEEVSTYSAAKEYLLIYRPSQGDHFCVEPISHPIDAFHQPELSGLQVLKTGESLAQALSWRFKTT
jgi:aldose 1-epimerase